MNYIEDGIAPMPAAGGSEQNTVFLIGDSIRIRYCEYVKKELEDTAQVVYPVENCRFTQYVITNIYDWAASCNPDSVAVVHFNCGHWDIAHWRGEAESLNDIPTYKKNIARIIRILKKLFPHAKIVFATTTTMHPDGIQGINPRTDAEIAAYNQAALQVCSSFSDITINDLYSVSKTFRADMFADYCHPTPEAAEILGKVTADCIRKLL